MTSNHQNRADHRLIVMTGGGTAGHVMPNLALLPDLLQAGYQVQYIGSKDIEAELVAKAQIPFHQISSGKLRRYASWENFLDIFKVLIGTLQAFFLMLRLRPSIVFSKGGFVSVPVAIGARLAGIPVVSHESDYSPGLANRIIAVFAKKILYSFPETSQYLKEGTGVYVPCPIRRELYSGDRKVGLSVCGFEDSGKPVVLIMGGSLGAQRLNDALLAILPKLILEYRVVHLTGKGKMISFQNRDYCAFEFLGDGLKDVYAMTDMVISRAGANSIFEMLALKIPMLLVPLGLGSRGDQILNAKSFEKKGWAHVLLEEHVTSESLYAAIDKLKSSSQSMRAAQAGVSLKDGGAQIVDILNKLSRKL